MRKEHELSKRLVILLSVAIAVVALAAGGAAFAFAGGGHGDRPDSEKPGALDDGNELVPQAKVKLAQAVAAARTAAKGKVGQIDLESDAGKVFYEVDVGDREVRVDASSGKVVSVERQS
jgi:uncharacterized membrane protein YkoI